jgi:uncharacterized protein YjiS (DUF1127 family)
MSITFDPAAAGASRGWTLLITSWQRLAEAPAINAEDRKVAAAIRQLSQFNERELNDIGLGRSDLTPEGLAEAGARRSLRQAAISAEIATRG